MPELPEVETIKLGLQKKIVGLKITKIQLLSTKSFVGNPSLTQGQKVLRVWRKAKILGVDLTSSLRGATATKQSKKEIATGPSDPRNDDNIILLFHLKMTGQLIYDDGKRFIGGHPTPDMRDQMPNPHTRVIVSFSDGSHLYFNDQRRFGWIKAIKAEVGKAVSDYIASQLGPEPLSKEFKWQILKQNLLRHKLMPIKVALMDQKVVSGIGNIYANEACFNAKIDPRTRVSELSDEQFQSLYKGVIKSLQEGIKHGGSSRTHFVDAEGHKGYFLDYAFVYGRGKHPCKVCGIEIKKVQLGGRGTYFCPKCQVLSS